MTHVRAAGRVFPGEEHQGCGGTIRQAHGPHGTYLGCSAFFGDGPGQATKCRTTWDTNGWAPTYRRLHATATGRPEGHDLRGLHPGHWQHHLMTLPAKGPGDFTPYAHQQDYAEYRVGLLARLRELSSVPEVHRARLRREEMQQTYRAASGPGLPRTRQLRAERQAELQPG